MIFKKTQTYKYGLISFRVDPKKPSVTVLVGNHKVQMKKSDLWQLAFMVSNKKEQDALIPIEKRPMMKFTRIFKVKATKDIKAGDIMEYHTDIDVPLLVVDQLLKEHGKELKDVLHEEDTISPYHGIDK